MPAPEMAETAGGVPGEMNQGLQLETTLDRQFGIWSAVALGVMCGCAWPLFGGTIVISLYNGGPPGVLYELIAISVLYLAVSASIAELASAIPSSAGVYHWAGIMGGPKYGKILGFVAGWYNCWAWIFSTIATSSISAVQLVSMYALFHYDYVFQRWHVLIAYYICSWISAALVVFCHHQLPHLNHIGLFWIVAGVFISVVVCAVMPATKGQAYTSSSTVWVDWQNDTGYSNNGFVFVLGMLNGAFALGVPDCVSHISEEISNPSRMVPQAIFAQVVIGSLSTLIYLITIFYATPNLSVETASTSFFPIAELYHQATGSKAATLGLQILIFLPSFWAIMGTYVTSGRTLWTLGRDNAAPFSAWLAQISPSQHSPMNATLAVVAINACIGLVYLGSTTAFSAFAGSVVCLVSISYLIAIAPHLLSGRKRVPAGWFFIKGWFGIGVHMVTCLYIIVFVVIFCFPYSMPVTALNMNYTSVVIGGISVAIVLLWYWKQRQSHGQTLVISGAGIDQIMESLHGENAHEGRGASENPKKGDLVRA
ncbi:hypothetical protein PV11_00361 [Exophiala sideris]|uniref:Choline transporter n=1 Tax=Exophiala sideris TaxID=1016849 RepID=A0A0D1ZCU4_9EURO|nr:hypothetical protein PV11_00361 [Exophiala sideris]